MQRKIIAILSGGLVLVSGAAWTTRPGADGLFTVVKQDVAEEIVAPGVVESVSDQVALSFEVPGRIEELLVAEGDRVAEGQLLARLDSRIAAARVAGAEAALESARARRDVALTGSRPEEIRAAEAEAEAAKANAWDREQWLARAEKLSGTNGVTPADLDNARGSAVATRAMQKAAEARLALVREGARPEARREAVAAVAAAEAELAEARTYLSQTELRAPRAGVVLRRYSEPGEQVVTTPQKTILTIADVDNLRLRVEIDESDVGRVSVGQRGYATADAYGERRFAGQIVRSTRELGRKTLRMDDPRARVDTRVLEVIFIPDEASALPLGLRMDVHVETVARRGVLTVPLSAVRGSAGARQVTVLVDGEETLREISLGADNGVLAEVVTGLREGELVKVRQN